MSLFKICTWWSTQCPDLLENYDSQNLLCCRLGLAGNEKDYIVVGSHTGHLSIFYPSSDMTDEGHFKGYKPTDLVLENKLKSPILGLLAGRFSGSSRNENSNQLAILHPLSLCVYNVATVDGVAEHGTHSNLQLIVEHKFSKPAFSICKGHFGKVKGREFLCVNHMEGTLTFYEQDGISYECRLPGDKTLPSILAYVPRTDSFVRVNSCWELENFSYQDLTQSAVGRTDIAPTWSLCIGEYAIDICPVQVTNSRTAIMILGEHNLLNISDEGKVQFVIKLDYSPKCFYSFVVGWYWEPNARLITAVVSESSSLLIYDDARIIWAAQLEEAPIAIQRSNLHNLPGGIVTLSATGFIHVGFLGSEPFVFQVPPLNLQEMHFEKAQKELIELEKEIKQGIDLTDVEMVNASAENDLELSFDVQSVLQTCDYDVSPKLSDKIVYKCPATVRLKAKTNLDQLQIYFSTDDAITTFPKSIFTFSNIVANSTEEIEVWFYVNDIMHVSTLQVESVASFINKQSIPRVLVRRALLPLGIIFQSAQAQKDGSIKITLTMNDSQKSNIHKLASIYPEFCEDNDIQAVGLSLLHTDEIVTVVSAKNTNRFRIQTDCLEAIPPVLEVMMKYIRDFSEQHELTKRGEKGRKGKGKHKFLLVAPNIPIDEVLSKVECHYNILGDIKKQTELMDSLWNQFKLFQRSLQSKTEDEPVDGIMMLVEKNYDDLVTEGDNLMALRNNERCKRNDLSCAIALTKHIVSCLDLEDRFTEGLMSALSYPIEDWSESNWEETVAPALDMLNHHGPLCRNKNAPLDTHPSLATAHFEFDRFKRHMTSLVDRVCRLASDPKLRQQLLAPSSASKNTELLLVGADNSQSAEADENSEAATDDRTATNARSGRSSGVFEIDNNNDEDNDSPEDSEWVSKEIPPAGLVMLEDSGKILAE